MSVGPILVLLLIAMCRKQAGQKLQAERVPSVIPGKIPKGYVAPLFIPFREVREYIALTIALAEHTEILSCRHLRIRSK